MASVRYVDFDSVSSKVGLKSSPYGVRSIPELNPITH